MRKRRTILQIKLRIASPGFNSVMCWIVPLTIPITPSALNVSPSKALSWVEQIVIAAADVKPLLTGVEMKFTMKPTKSKLMKNWLEIILSTSLRNALEHSKESLLLSIKMKNLPSCKRPMSSVTIPVKRQRITAYSTGFPLVYVKVMIERIAVGPIAISAVDPIAM